VFNYEKFIPITTHSFNNVFEDITKTIGNTPLVRLNNIAKEENLFGTILLKLEFFNPLNSVKDRIGV
jgi:cysteine synthase A